MARRLEGNGYKAVLQRRKLNIKRWNEFFCRLIPVRVKLQGLWAGKEAIQEYIVKYRGETLKKSSSIGPLSLTSVLQLMIDCPV
jgi:hypothetical protein